MACKCCRAPPEQLHPGHVDIHPPESHLQSSGGVGGRGSGTARAQAAPSQGHAAEGDRRPFSCEAPLPAPPHSVHTSFAGSAPAPTSPVFAHLMHPSPTALGC